MEAVIDEEPRLIPLKSETTTRTVPFVTVLLVTLNTLVYIYESVLSPRELETLILQMGLIPATLTEGAIHTTGLPLPVTFLTSMFLHGGLIHLLGNMLYLWVFGNDVEDAAGHFRFLMFYLVCGFAAALTQTIAAPHSKIPMIGASGAIAGVLGAYMVKFPRARVLTLVPLFFFIRLMSLPAIVVLGLWFLYQVLLSRAPGAASGGGVAFFAHIGGFVAGMFLIVIFQKSRRNTRDAGAL